MEGEKEELDSEEEARTRTKHKRKSRRRRRISLQQRGRKRRITRKWDEKRSLKERTCEGDGIRRSATWRWKKSCWSIRMMRIYRKKMSTMRDVGGRGIGGIGEE